MTVSIRIDGRQLNVAKGLTILQAARQHDIYIPTLCDFPGLPPHGSCRMCIVEIEGKAVTPTACTALVEEGMQIATNSPKIQALRNELLLMLLADHPSICLFCTEQSHCDECMVTLRKAGVTTGCRSCPKDGQCGLQEMVAKFGLAPVGVDLRVDPLRIDLRVDPLSDPGRTHRCAPTAQISDSAPTKPLRSYPPRYRMLPVKKDDPFFDRDYNLCVLCGRCIRTCTELHFASALAYTKRGAETVVGTAFNRSQIEAGCSFCGTCVEACPTGALSEKTRKWDGAPQAEIETTCPLCSIACSIRLLTKDGQVIGSLPNRAAGSEALCVKGRFGMVELLNHPSRLKQPQKNSGAHRLEISWEEALQLAAEKCAACPPEKFAVVVSASSSSEELYLAQKLVHQAGATHIYAPDLDAYGDGLGLLADLLKRAQPLSALDHASEILCLGLDGKYAQSVVEVKLHAAQKRGARLVTVYPREHSLGDYADEWVREGEGKLSRRLGRALQSKPSHEARKRNPTSRNAPGSGNSSMNAEPVGFRLRIQRQMLGMKRSTQPTHRLVLASSSSPVIIVGPAFLTQPNSAAFLQSVQSLLDETGAELILLPEHANLAAALRLGVLPASALPRDVEVLYVTGENLPAQLPGNAFILYQNLYPPSGQRTADLLLPMAAFSEGEGSLLDAAGHTHTLRQAVSSPGSALPAWQILCRLGQKMGLPGFDYATLADLQAEMAVGADLRVDPGRTHRGAPTADPGRTHRGAPTVDPGRTHRGAPTVDPGRTHRGAPTADPGRTHRCAPTETSWQNPLSTTEPAYLGFPLSHWVAGLKAILRN